MFEKALILFPTISLPEVQEAGLQDRFDVKFVIPLEVLERVLSLEVPNYRVMEIEGKQILAYSTTYFDTPELELYLQHHNGRLPRFKVRVREYVDTASSFLEIKKKTNKGRTTKVRRALDQPTDLLSPENYEYIKKHAGSGLSELKATCMVYYKRITLVRNDFSERITIDVQLSAHRDYQTIKWPHAIVEIKKDGRKSVSDFSKAIQSLGYKPFSFSKYCWAINTLLPSVKQNLFKPKYHKLKKSLHVASLAVAGSA